MEYVSKKRNPLLYAAFFFLFVLLFAALTIGLWMGFIYLSGNGNGNLFRESVQTEQDAGKRSETVIILDAGHGGEDGGTSGENGVTEKELNLAVANTLADFFRANGMRVILTREDDRLLYDRNADYMGRKKMLDLRGRLNIIEKAQQEYPDAEILFISIHMNAYPAKNVEGLQVWYSANREESFGLAEAIQETTHTLLQKENNRKVKKAGSNIYLLDRTTVPAVLVECGFLSNTAECEALSTESYRQKIAFTIYSAVISWKEKAQS